MARHSQRFRYSPHDSKAAVVVAVQEPYQSAHALASSALELARLARGLGMIVVRTVVQARAQASAATLLSQGRLEELLALIGADSQNRAEPSPDDSTRLTVDIVLFDCALSPAQQRALEHALGVEILDRSAVILRIFERRARTREARMQVELARLLYEAPRVRDDRSLGDREGGGGRGGRGHSNVELRKQEHRAAIAELRRELALLGEVAQLRRTQRRQLPQVALVGYTNAGKSSLMRALTGSDVLIEDELFATLGLTVRALAPKNGQRILVSDTVGFIANLPHELVASFRATLEEARHANLLLVVADVSDRDFREQLYITQQTLAQIGAGDVPQTLVLNKVDRLSLARREAIAAEFADAILVSAHSPADITRLRDVLLEQCERELFETTFVCSYSQGALLSEMHEHARIVEQRHTPRGTLVRVRARQADVSRWRKLLAAERTTTRAERASAAVRRRAR